MLIWGDYMLLQALFYFFTVFGIFEFLFFLRDLFFKKSELLNILNGENNDKNFRDS